MAKKASLFPGQGSQFVGMGKDLYDSNSEAKALFERANEVLGFGLSRILFEGTDEELKQTRVTQPAVFVHSYISAAVSEEGLQADMMAGHSLGEFTALAASGALCFEDALRLVSKRAEAMQKACEEQPSTMAAILGLEDDVVEELCAKAKLQPVIVANYNCPGQAVISGSVEGVEEVITLAKEAGAKRAMPLKVSGAFHSPFMESARASLEEAIRAVDFHKPSCPIYQNVDARPYQEPEAIRANLIKQLTSPVLWTQSVRAMIQDGATDFVEYGPGNVLEGLLKRIRK